MKKFIKNNIKIFMTILITTIIVGSVSVYATSQYFAKDISFTPTNENFKKENGEPIENVEDALNKLYVSINNGGYKNSKDIYSNNSITAHDVDVSTEKDCHDYTIDNFRFKNLQLSWHKIKYGDYSNYLLNNYDSENCLLKLNQSTGQAGDYGFFINYTIELVY